MELCRKTIENEDFTNITWSFWVICFNWRMAKLTVAMSELQIILFGFQKKNTIPLLKMQFRKW